MLHRSHGVPHAHQRPHLVAAVAARVDHDLGTDLTLRRGHGPGVVGVLPQPGDGGVPVDLGALGPGAPRQRRAELGRVHVAVGGVPQSAREAVGRQQRMAAGTLGGVDDIELHPHAVGHGGEVAIALHGTLVAREPDAAVAVMVADGVVRVLRKLPVERDGVGLQPHHGLVHAEVRDLRRGVPSRARGQLVALQEHDVGPAFPGQVVERRAAGDPAADHDHTGLGPHRALPRSPVTLRDPRDPVNSARRRFEEMQGDLALGGRPHLQSCSAVAGRRLIGPTGGRGP